jgi:hypothetical protein
MGDDYQRYELAGDRRVVRPFDSNNHQLERRLSEE